MDKYSKIFIIIVLFVGSLLAASDIKVYLRVAPQEIYSGEELNVSLNIETPKRVDIKFPDIDKIAKVPIVAIKDVKRNIIKEHNGSAVSVVKISRIYTILPTKSSTIGPLSVTINGQEYKADRKKVKVVNSSGKGDNFVFRMSSSKKELVVGEPFIVKVELVEPTALSGSKIEYLAPRFKNFTVTPLGRGEFIQKGNNVIRTIRYLLKAKDTGEYILEPARAKIEMQAIPVAQSPFAFFGDEAQFKNIATNTVSVKVDKLPQKVDLIGDFTLKTDVDRRTRSAKKPIEFTLTLSGSGSLDDFKGIQLSIPGVVVYPKEPVIKNSVINGTLESKYTRKYILIAQKDFVIPSIVLSEYNLKKRVVEKLKSEEITIHIKPATSIASLLQGKKEEPIQKHQRIGSVPPESPIVKNRDRQSQKAQKSIKKESQSEKIEEILIDKSYYKRKYTKEGYSFGLLLLIALLSLLLGFVVAWYLPAIFAKRAEKEKESKLYENFEEALNILYPHTTSDPKIEEMVKILYEVVNGNNSLTIDKKSLDKMIKKIKKQKR